MKKFFWTLAWYADYWALPLAFGLVLAHELST